jgi:hypothetical protein
VTYRWEYQRIATSKTPTSSRKMAHGDVKVRIRQEEITMRDEKAAHSWEQLPRGTRDLPSDRREGSLHEQQVSARQDERLPVKVKRAAPRRVVRLNAQESPIDSSEITAIA